jgi:hypothetical protein
MLNALSVFMCVLMSTIQCLLLGLEVCCVHYDSFIGCESWKVGIQTMGLELQSSSFIMFIISFPKSSICGSTFTFCCGKLFH